MRKAIKSQRVFLQIEIKDIRDDTWDRDNIPTALLGLQLRYPDEGTCGQLFKILEERVRSNVSKRRRRKSLRRIFVLGTLKQVQNVDYDRLVELASHHNQCGCAGIGGGVSSGAVVRR